MRPIVARINLAALASNLELARAAAPESKLFAVVKADAYGHGMVKCIDSLSRAQGLAVATVEEGVELREAHYKGPILVLSAFCNQEDVALLLHYKLMPVIHSQYQIQLLKNVHSNQHIIQCWLKVDTGMNRLGFSKDDFFSALETINKLKGIKLAGLMSHFACSDEEQSEFTNQQLDLFDHLTKDLIYPLSLANSGGVLAWQRSHKDWNRPGIMLYGASPFEHLRANDLGLAPVMQFKSQLIAVKTLEKGQGLGYGHDFIADKKMAVGIVTCGYADGYPRSARSGSPILVSGIRTATLGRVSMDSLAVDLSGIKNAQVGNEVTLWGDDLPVEEVAKNVNTVSYDLLTGVSKRVPREYVT